MAAPSGGFALEHVRFNLAAQREDACQANMHDRLLKASVSWNSEFIRFHAHSNSPRRKLMTGMSSL